MIERTLVLIKPDGVERGLIGRVLSRFEDAGLKLTGMKMQWIDDAFSKKHYAAHVQKNFYRGLEDFIISGPVVALVLEGVHAIDLVRKMVGDTEPLKAAPGTIRGDFAAHSYAHADKKGIAVKNIIHASANKEDAAKEVGLWFESKELHSYTSVHERHTF
jgi:nucleoside-diphosphate kinase